MPNIQTLSVAQLRKAVELKEQIEKLETQLASLTGNGSSGKRRKLSAASRARISAGMRAKWAKRKGLAPKQRKMSAAGRAAIRAAQKARWARMKAEKK